MSRQLATQARPGAETTPKAADCPLQRKRPRGAGHELQRATFERAEVSDSRAGTHTLSHSGHDFSRIPMLPGVRAPLQPKLTVNAPGDAYEQEADRISEQVMRMPQPQVQRACACGGGCQGCQIKEASPEGQRVQTKRVGSGDAGHAEAPPVVHEVLRSPGQPLDTATRAFMEPRFGHDFSRVRVHSDAKAAESAQAVGALAYTVGRHVVFENGAYQPEVPDGRRLLAHELAHVMQQHATPESGMLRRKEGDLALRDEEQRPAPPPFHPRPAPPVEPPPPPPPPPRPASCGHDICTPGSDCVACCNFYCKNPSDNQDCRQVCNPYR